jgi:hypothetical protein
MKNIEEYAREVTKSAGIHPGSEEERIIHDSIYGVFGSKHNSFDPNSLNKYINQVVSKISRTDGNLGRKVVPHLSSVLKK